MKRLTSILSVVVLLPFAASWAQLRTPNQAGISLGQWHTVVHDVEATRKFWMLLGGIPIKIDGTDVMKFPGVLIFVTKGEPSGGSEGTPVNHVGFGVANVRKLFEKMDAAKPAGVKITRFRKSGLNGQNVFNMYTPDGLEIEITEEAGVAPYPQIAANTSIESNHIHFAVPVAPEGQAWYAKTFGGMTTKLGNNLIVDIPGVKFLRFGTGGKAQPVPTKGRALDYIGFEVRNLEAFCKRQQASGVKFDAPYSKSRHKGFASAELTDPWGTSIELTEGLNRY